MIDETKKTNSNKKIYMNKVKNDLEKVFDLYYELVSGFEHDDLYYKQDKNELNEVVKGEFFPKDGKFYNLFDKLMKLQINICEMESERFEYRLEEEPEEFLSKKLWILYWESIREVSKLMFMYGVQYGKSLEEYLSDIIKYMI